LTRPAVNAPVLLLAILGIALASDPAPARAALPDGRAWEIVSPPEKNGGDVAAPDGAAQALAGAGVFRAAAGGGAVAYPSAASFGEAEGAAPISQYLAARDGAGWSSANLTPPLLSGTYEGDPYLAFSDDLARAILSNGWSCRGDAASCRAENPPLGPGAPAGYRNLYLREGTAYTPLVTEADSYLLTVGPEEFEIALQGASPDLRHVVFSTNAGLYEWSEGAIQELSASPGAALGGRVYLAEGGNLYLREGGSTRLVSEGGEFQAATPSGTLAFYLKAGRLWRYSTATGESEDLGEAAALAGVSADGSYLYYVTVAGLYLLHDGVSTQLLSAQPAALPPASGPAAVAAGGARLLFTTSAHPLLGDTDGRPDAYEWEAQGTGSCASALGCLGLISGGRSGEATFAAASASGEDAYFTTDASLLGGDEGATDLYDARVGGGFPEPAQPIPCEGDACQGPPPGPEDPTPGTATFEGPGNPPVRFHQHRRRKHHRRRHHHRHRGGR
jgi:hypothetical protein